jgi:hypothetical protein
MKGGRLTVTTRDDLARRVWAVTGGLGAALAAGCALLGTPADALGAVVGSLLAGANFGALAWAADRASAASTPATIARRVMWVGASGLRLALVAVAVGVAVRHLGAGVPGLALSLAVSPVAVIWAGLAGAPRA